MPCRPFKTETSYGFACGGRRPKPCAYCKRPSSQLCDFPVGKTKAGKTKTCDVPLCEKCTKKGVSPDIDFCKEHYPLALAAFERRQAKLQEKR